MDAEASERIRKIMALVWHASGPYTVFDLETTGMSPVHDRIIEIGAVRIGTDGTLSRFETLVNPRVPIQSKIAAITGITNEMVAEAPVFDEVGLNFLDFIRGSKLVAHNARFDLAFLQESLSRSGFPVMEHGAFDSLSLVRKAYPGQPSYSLQALKNALGLGEAVRGDAHRALYDAEITTELFTITMNRLYQIYS